MHVKLSVCSHEQVANGMAFSRELIESKMSQLDFLPIVGLVKIAEKSDGTCAYILGDHETELEVVDGELQYTSKTVVLGTALPNTAKFEPITRHGETKEYVTVEALLYTNKYPQLKSVINMDTDASMEIDCVDYDWNDDDCCFGVKDFRYTAHCLISVQPAFRLAGVTSVFAMDDFKQEYAELLEEVKVFSLNINKNFEEGDDNVADIQEQEVVEVEEMATETTEETTTESETTEVEMEASSDEVEVAEMEQEVVADESIEMSEDKDDEEDKDDDDDEDEMAKKKKRCSEEDVEVVNYEEKFNALQTQFDTLQAQFEEMNEKYQVYVAKEQCAIKEDIVATFSGKLTEEEIKACVGDMNAFSATEIETMLTLELGKKAKSEAKVDFAEVKETKEFATFSNFEGNSYFANLAKKIKNIQK